MHHFAYRAGVMHAEAVDLASLADAVGTPFYCYSTATLQRHGEQGGRDGSRNTPWAELIADQVRQGRGA